MSENNTNIVPAGPQGSLLPEWWRSSYGWNMYHTTLNVEVPEQRDQLLSSLTEECIPFKDVINTRLEVVAYTISPASREDDSGEISEWLRIALHLADGRNISCASSGVLRSLMLRSQLMGLPPWNPPLSVTARVRDIGGGKQWCYLQSEAAPRSKKPPK